MSTLIIRLEKRDIVMNKKTEKKAIVSVNKRNATALRTAKVAVNLLKTKDSESLDTLLSHCTKQNQIIDVMCKNDKNVTDIASMLLSRNMFTSLDYAIKRVKRHIKNDRITAIAKRHISITANTQE